MDGMNGSGRPASVVLTGDKALSDHNNQHRASQGLQVDPVYGFLPSACMPRDCNAIANEPCVGLRRLKFGTVTPGLFQVDSTDAGQRG